MYTNFQDSVTRSAAGTYLKLMTFPHYNGTSTQPQHGGESKLLVQNIVDLIESKCTRFSARSYPAIFASTMTLLKELLSSRLCFNRYRCQRSVQRKRKNVDIPPSKTCKRPFRFKDLIQGSLCVTVWEKNTVGREHQQALNMLMSWPTNPKTDTDIRSKHRVGV